MAPKKQAIATYTVKTPLQHGRTRYAPGDTVDLADNDAAALLRLGVIEAAPAAAAPEISN